jgi:hypothetical protein
MADNDDSRFESNECVNSLSCDLVIGPDDCSFGDSGMHDKRRFDLGRGETMTGYVDDICQTLINCRKLPDG